MKIFYLISLWPLFHAHASLPILLPPVFPLEISSETTAKVNPYRVQFTSLLIEWNLLRLAQAANSAQAWTQYENAITEWFDHPAVKDNPIIASEVKELESALQSKDRSEITSKYLNIIEKINPPSSSGDHPLVASTKKYLTAPSTKDRISAYSQMSHHYAQSLLQQNCGTTSSLVQTMGQCYRQLKAQPNGRYDQSSCLDHYVAFAIDYTDKLAAAALIDSVATTNTTASNTTASSSQCPPSSASPPTIKPTARKDATPSPVPSPVPPAPVAPVAPAAVAVTPESRLREILSQMKFDPSQVKALGRGLSYNNPSGQRIDILAQDDGTVIHVNRSTKATTEVYVADQPGSKQLALFKMDGTLFNPPGFTANHFAKELDGIAAYQRSRAIYLAKTKNTECYLKLAKKRLGLHYAERLLALERPQNPRPLAFSDDQSFSNFKAWLQSVLSPLDPKGKISILGTSTTFYSNNPHKGKSKQALKQPCDESDEVYTFDTKKTGDSDLDVHLFGIKFANACHDHHVGGNKNPRAAYFENTLSQCFPSIARSSTDALSPPLVVTKPDGTKETLRTVQAVKDARYPIPNRLLYTTTGPFLAGYREWVNRLKPREINFSVHILPSHRPNHGGPKPDDHFRNDPEAHTRFSFDIQP